MGKRILRKLGSVLRVFRRKKKKNADISSDNSTILSNSESVSKTSDKSSSEQIVYLRNFFEAKKSKSFDNIAASSDTSNDDLNKLKRSHGTCDIFGAEQDCKIKYTRSLHRFSKVSDMKPSFLSYNAKLQDSTAWSRALGRVIENPYNKYDANYASTTTQAESEPLLPKRGDFFQSRELLRAHKIETKRKYSSKEHKLEEVANGNSKCTERYLRSERTVTSKSKYGVTTHQQNTERYSTVTSFSSDIHSVEVSEETREPSEGTEEIISSVKNELMGSSGRNKFENNRFENHSDKSNESYNSSESNTVRETSSKISTGKQKSQILLEKQRVQVNMEFKTVRNDEGFSLLKYDMKSAGDHVKEKESFLDMYAPLANSKLLLDDQVENIFQECDLSKNTSSKTHSEGSTEYDLVNLNQVDLLEDFKTTIANMRNVLDALEIKKSIQGIIRQSMSEKRIDQNLTKFIEPKIMNALPTQINNLYNQISTSTDIGFSCQRKKGYVVVQPSCEQLSKGIANSNTVEPFCFNHIKPLKTVQKRKRRRKMNTFKYDKLSRKMANVTSSSFDKAAKARMKHEKSQYNKCVVYHITQHKQAADRCVGTSLPTSNRDSIVLHKTFSALHFGPIQEFPVLLNKHENEKNKSKELKCKLKCHEKHVSTSANKRLTFKELKCQGQIHHKGNEQFDSAENKNSSYTGIPSTTANWFVFEPSPPLVVQNNQTTSDDTVFEKNTSSCSAQERPLYENIREENKNNTTNLVKYQIPDKLNEITTKDAPHITITVNVPIKEIVSKLKASEVPDCDSGIVYSILKGGHLTRPQHDYPYDFGVQVNDANKNNSMQSIPKQIRREASMLYPENEQLPDGTNSLKRLSSFKNIFRKKTLGFNTNLYDLIPQTSSKLYFSDQSTSCPDFLLSAYNRPKFSDKSISVELVSFPDSPVSYQKNEFGVNTNLEPESFFLNLPRNRNKKKRDQISKLFDVSDSSDFKLFEHSKLLYHVHDSSFYSSSRTDNIFTSDEAHSTKGISSRDRHEPNYFPVHNIASSVNIKMEPLVNKFSEFHSKNESVDKTEINGRGFLSQANEIDFVHPNNIAAGIIENILNDKTFTDSGIQCESFFLSPQDEVEVGINTYNGISKMQVERETETYFNVSELSIQNLPKVRFEDEVHTIGEEKNMNVKFKYKKNRIGNATQNKKIMKTEHTKKRTLNKAVSVNPFFRETEYKKIKNYEKKVCGDVSNLNIEKPINLHIVHKTKSTEIAQVSSDSNLLPEKLKILQAKTRNSATPISSRKKYESQKSRKVFEVESSETCSTLGLFQDDEQKESVEIEKHKNNKNSQLNQILNSNNFEKSRDSIVDLILYNLMKEIIMESSEHLSEQGKVKVESILTNFVKEFKYESENKDIRLVESTIQHLVKEIDSNSLFNFSGDHHRKYRQTYQKKNEDIHRQEYEHDQNYHSKSKNGKHMRGFKHKNYNEVKRIVKPTKQNHWDCESSYKSIEQCNKKEKRNIWNESPKSVYTEKDEQQYVDLIEKIRELENITKQLLLAAQNQPVSNKKSYRQQHEKRYPFRECQNVFPVLVDHKLPKYSKNDKSQFNMRSRKNSICKRVRKNFLNLNYQKNKFSCPVLAISRQQPKVPMTKIIINLSNWRSVSRKCTSLISTSNQKTSVPINEIEHEQQLRNKTLIFRISEDMKEERVGVYNTEKEATSKLQSKNESANIRRNKKSITITIRGRNTKGKAECYARNHRPIKKRRDCIKIKMTRKNRTSSNYQQKSVHRSEKKVDGNNIDLNEVYKITKQYVQREYALKSDQLCSNVANNLLGRGYNIAEVLGDERNLDLAYQRMANFCMFRGLFKRKQNNN